ncbi:hypothetical protein Moror_8627 [Moniliophthora roreri MCA 2997]|uniref:Uncharacterized protein n=1 Tax=Moniliophthora roreri (strain MCA 2997) TaxID=1381753 RepID=V2XB02_MONRO|nr:hypothetical protein Moror_8627 [Moniliophthora roreri MCA 2997]
MKNATRINSWENRCIHTSRAPDILVKINTRATDSIVTIENPKLEESKHVPTAIDMTMKKAKMGSSALLRLIGIRLEARDKTLGLECPHAKPRKAPSFSRIASLETLIQSQQRVVLMYLNCHCCEWKSRYFVFRTDLGFGSFLRWLFPWKLPLTLSNYTRGHLRSWLQLVVPEHHSWTESIWRGRLFIVYSYQVHVAGYYLVTALLFPAKYIVYGAPLRCVWESKERRERTSRKRAM